MKNKKIIAGNWKMNTTLFEAKNLANDIKKDLQATDNVEVVLCPPFVNIQSVIDSITNSQIQVGAQNCYFEESGAFTGEISTGMLKKVGCDYVIIGHSERRSIFGESNSLINKKIRAGLESGLKVIFCIGESLEERENNDTFPVLGSQIKEGLADIDSNLFTNLVLAYEPVWAIGTGKTANSKQITEAHNRIRDFLTEIAGKIGLDIPILYGGSMKDTNAEQILNCENVAGGLIGGASLKADKFLNIIDIAQKI